MANYHDEINRLEDVKTFLTELGYNVLYVAVFGSQNYGLDGPESDHDYKAIIMPSLRYLMDGKQYRKEIEYGDGHIVVFDVKGIITTACKGNPTLLEIFHTPYYIGNYEIRAAMQTIEINLHSILGTICERERQLTKAGDNHGTEIEKYGYVGKQLAHTIRSVEVIKNIIAGNKRKPYITYDSYNETIQLLRDIKEYNVVYPVDLAVHYMGIYREQASKLIKEYNPGKYDTEGNYEKHSELIYKLIGEYYNIDLS